MLFGAMTTPPPSSRPAAEQRSSDRNDTRQAAGRFRKRVSNKLTSIL
jgi:hypothetical protein